jgi:hypothetical protein
MSQDTVVSPDLAKGKQATGRLYRSHYIHTLWVQGIYYLLTGLWPLVSIGTFQMVTGEKTDVWLVHTAPGRTGGPRSASWRSAAPWCSWPLM